MASTMQITCFVLAIARLDPPEKWVVILLMSRPGPVPEEVVLDRLARTSKRAKVERALRRLLQDRVVAAVQSGHLQVADPRSWPPHRVNSSDLTFLEQLVAHAHGQDHSQMTTELVQTRAVALAREVAHRQLGKGPPTGKIATTPKVQPAIEDDDDLSWLDPPIKPAEDPVVTMPSKSKLAINDPSLLKPTTTQTSCSSCDNARKILEKPGDVFQNWASAHLANCQWSAGNPAAAR